MNIYELWQRGEDNAMALEIERRLQDHSRLIAELADTATETAERTDDRLSALEAKGCECGEPLENCTCGHEAYEGAPPSDEMPGELWVDQNMECQDEDEFDVVNGLCTRYIRADLAQTERTTHWVFTSGDSTAGTCHRCGFTTLHWDRCWHCPGCGGRIVKPEDV